MSSPRRALLVAAFDSQLKWCAGLRDELEARGFTCRAVAPVNRVTLSPGQVRDAGFDRVDTLQHDDLLAAMLASDVVVLALVGPQVRDWCLELADHAGPGRKGPVLVSGWVGVIIEKITAGYLDRCGTDVVAVNAAHDLQHFEHAARCLDLPSDNLVLAGLPFLSGVPDPQRTGPIRTVLWADQPTVPAARADRRYVYQRLVDYARRHPDRTVLLKPRHRLDEDTFHRMQHHPEDLLSEMSVPANLHVDYTPIADLLPRTDLLLTTSSTACLEAIDHGIRVGLVLDLGVHERLGNHVLLDSGLLRTFDQLEADDIGTPTPEWIAAHFVEPLDREGAATPATVVADRVETLLSSGDRPSRRMWDSPYIRGVREVGEARRHEADQDRSTALLRRRRRHGGVLGTLLHLIRPLTPPVVSRPVRRHYLRWRQSRQLGTIDAS